VPHFRTLVSVYHTSEHWYLCATLQNTGICVPHFRTAVVKRRFPVTTLRETYCVVT